MQEVAEEARPCPLQHQSLARQSISGRTCFLFRLAELLVRNALIGPALCGARQSTGPGVKSAFRAGPAQAGRQPDARLELRSTQSAVHRDSRENERSFLSVPNRSPTNVPERLSHHGSQADRTKFYHKYNRTR